MNLKKVTTNFGTFYTEASNETIRKWSYEYIKAYLAMHPTHRLSGAIFSWGEVLFIHHASTHVGVAMIPSRDRERVINLLVKEKVIK